MSLPLLTITPVSNTTQARAYLPHFEMDFTKLYNESKPILSLESPLPDLDVEQHFSLINTAWEYILNLTAPLKFFLNLRLKPNLSPGLIIVYAP